MRTIIRFVLLLLVTLFPFTASADIRSDVKAIFAQDMATVDLARTKFEIDHLVDLSTDVDAGVAEIDRMAATVKDMLPPDADSWAKVEAIRQFIYQPGPWNENRPFAYDHDGVVAKLTLEV